MLLSVAAIGAGPFGTFVSMDAGQRSVYWSLIITLSVVLGYSGHALSLLMIKKCHVITRFALEGIISTSLITPVVWGVGRLSIFADASVDISFAQAFGYVALITAAVVTIRAIVMLSFGLESRAVTRVKPRLAQRLPDDIGSYILCLSVSDHFVKIVTDRGEKCVRMRLSDAIAEMEGVEGFQVHRSHWVAKDAIRSAHNGQGRAMLSLACGTQVPVSRNYRPVLEKAGIL
ncbi:LytTR family DNA-binding domain-containing protein [Shimia sp.]|uniref:LytTR family DNA-binding domain-containing protein n=1 Tax=Shimia sp. TaxID=1954381 RepID=UPI003298C402